MFYLELNKDEIYKKFINFLLKQGKKSVAEKIMKGTLVFLEEKGYNPEEVIFSAIQNSCPLIEVRSRRQGRRAIQVPMPLSTKRQASLTLRWLVEGAQQRSELTMSERLAGELIASSKGQGHAVRKQLDMHKRAKASKAFAHLN